MGPRRPRPGERRLIREFVARAAPFLVHGHHGVDSFAHPAPGVVLLIGALALLGTGHFALRAVDGDPPWVSRTHAAGHQTMYGLGAAMCRAVL